MRTACAIGTDGLRGAVAENVSPATRKSPVSGLSASNGSRTHAVPLCQPETELLKRGQPINTPSAINASIATVEALTSHSRSKIKCSCTPREARTSSLNQ